MSTFHVDNSCPRCHRSVDEEKPARRSGSSLCDPCADDDTRRVREWKLRQRRYRERNAAILEAWSRGATHAWIASAHGISPKRVREIVAQAGRRKPQGQETG